jgi:hypothetical protein
VVLLSAALFNTSPDSRTKHSGEGLLLSFEMAHDGNPQSDSAGTTSVNDTCTKVSQKKRPIRLVIENEATTVLQVLEPRRKRPRPTRLISGAVDVLVDNSALEASQKRSMRTRESSQLRGLPRLAGLALTPVAGTVVNRGTTERRKESRQLTTQKKATSRVPKKNWARVKPSLGQEDPSPSVLYDGTEGTILWDPRRAKVAQDEGQDIGELCLTEEATNALEEGMITIILL